MDGVHQMEVDETSSQQPLNLVQDPPTHPEDENFAGNLWL